LKRIFYTGALTDYFTIDGDYFHYLKNVVRAKAGDVVGVLTSTHFAECEIEQMEKRSAEFKVINIRDVMKHGYQLKVYQCLLKREYMDFAVEKYTELGATEIVPVVSSRSLTELKDKTKQRYNDIAMKAILQSENEQMPVISDAIGISEITADMDSNIIFYERCEEGSSIKPALNMSMVIGPEGGFTDDEFKLLTEKGFQAVKPIQQILKAETASVVFTGYIRILQEKLEDV